MGAPGSWGACRFLYSTVCWNSCSCVLCQSCTSICTCYDLKLHSRKMQLMGLKGLAKALQKLAVVVKHCVEETPCRNNQEGFKHDQPQSDGFWNMLPVPASWKHRWGAAPDPAANWAAQAHKERQQQAQRVETAGMAEAVVSEGTWRLFLSAVWTGSRLLCREWVGMRCEETRARVGSGGARKTNRTRELLL